MAFSPQPGAGSWDDRHKTINRFWRHSDLIEVKDRPYGSHTRPRFTIVGPTKEKASTECRGSKAKRPMGLIGSTYTVRGGLRRPTCTGMSAGFSPLRMRPTKYQLVINLKAAKSLCLEVPLHRQQIADEVIE